MLLRGALRRSNLGRETGLPRCPFATLRASARDDKEGCQVSLTYERVQCIDINQKFFYNIKGVFFISYYEGSKAY